MRPYNPDRRTFLTCKYGCCRMRKSMNAELCNRRGRKASRREGKVLIKEQLCLSSNC